MNEIKELIKNYDSEIKAMDNWMIKSMFDSNHSARDISEATILVKKEIRRKFLNELEMICRNTPL